MRSNVQQWQQLQGEGYFDKHGAYQAKSGGLIEGGSDDAIIEQFVPLRKEMNVVIIGCGYGRDAAVIAPKVRHVWGIDVSDDILARAKQFVTDRSISNFTPVHVYRYRDEIPNGIDVVYSLTVMQHLTRDLVMDYFTTLSQKLSPTGRLIVQFYENLLTDRKQTDAALEVHEPAVSWALSEIALMCKGCGLKFEARSSLVTPIELWHTTNAYR